MIHHRIITPALAITALVVLLSALGGCKRRNTDSPRPQPSNQPLVQADTTTQPSVGDLEVEEEPVDPRTHAIEVAYESLVRGDRTGVDRTLELGADTMLVVRKAIESENINATTGAVKVLARIPDEADAVELMRKALAHSALSVRSATLDAIADGKVAGLADDVAALIGDEELELRATACETTAALGTPSAQTIGAIFSALRDPEDVVRAACAAAFGPISKDSDQWRERVAELLDDAAVPAREGALRVLATWRDDTSFQLIRGRLEDKSAVVVAGALAALAPFGSAEAVLAVQKFVRDERLAVRIEAVAALEQLPVDDVLPLVYAAIGDSDPAVRIEATSQLPRHPGPETTIRLIGLLEDNDLGVRAAAAIAFGEMGDSLAFSALLERLKKETDPMVGAYLVDALAEADAKRAIPHLIDLLDDAESTAKTRIIVQLRERTGQSDLPAEGKAWREWYRAQTPDAPAPSPPAPPPEAPDAESR